MALAPNEKLVLGLTAGDAEGVPKVNEGVVVVAEGAVLEAVGGTLKDKSELVLLNEPRSGPFNELRSDCTLLAPN